MLVLRSCEAAKCLRKRLMLKCFRLISCLKQLPTCFRAFSLLQNQLHSTPDTSCQRKRLSPSRNATFTYKKNKIIPSTRMFNRAEFSWDKPLSFVSNRSSCVGQIFLAILLPGFPGDAIRGPFLQAAPGRENKAKPVQIFQHRQWLINDLDPAFDWWKELWIG